MKKCMKCGGSTKMKKMAKGGPINKPMTYGKIQKGGDNQKMNMYGMPQIGQGAMDGKTGQMKKGGMVKKQTGGPATKPVAKGTPNPNKYVQSAPGGGYSEISARQYATTPQGQRKGMQELSPAQYESNKSRISPMKAKKGGTMKKYAKGGSTFGMLSVKAGVDKNPKATAADRIAGAKMSKKMGGSIKAKKK